MGMIIGFDMNSYHSSYNYVHGLEDRARHLCYCPIIVLCNEIGYYFITCLLYFHASSS